MEKEFYPVDADQVEKEDALQHSLNKWEGLRDENVKKHDVTKIRATLAGYDDDFHIGSNSCALCEYHLRSYRPITCWSCPLSHVEDHAPPEACNDEYQRYIKNGDPEPMIKLIKAAIENDTNQK